jgi:nitrite reductase/ring-hydroxylating ferredoxin subunit/uncharacterized membrane protein
VVRETEQGQDQWTEFPGEDSVWWSTVTGRLEQARSLDPVVERVESAVNRILPPGTVKDALHGRWLGHALHPLLIALPIGFWSGASLLDLTPAREGSRRAAQRLVGAGLLVAVPTAASGLADWSALGAFHRPKRVGFVHAATNTAAAVLYGASWLARRRGDQDRGRLLALTGAGGLAVGGYLGGHLAYSQAVGVNRNADQQREPRDWTDAAAAAQVVEGGLHRVEVAGIPVVLTRLRGEVLGLAATCSHYGGPLEEAEVVDDCLVCPWHGSRFRLADGSVARGPATAAQAAYEVRISGERIQLRISG